MVSPIKCSLNLGLVQPSTSNETLSPISNLIKVVKSCKSFFFFIHKQQSLHFFVDDIMIDTLFKSTNLLKHFEIILLLLDFFKHLSTSSF